MRLLATAAVAAALASALAACAGARAPRGLRVVAAENFWGSIAAQLAGGRAPVTSIIVDPAQDPHAYEPSAADARALATARLVIFNGLGYDPWVSRLLAANPTPGRAVLNVGSLLGLKDDANPHRWYDPADVEAVADAIAGDLERLDPAHASYYQQRRLRFETVDLAPYRRLIAAIRGRYAGVPVGASESIFALLAPALGLRLETPSTFMKAIGEGADVSARDALATQRQIDRRQILVWVYNSQNATPAVQQLNARASAHGIPVTTITETLDPASASFEQWQVAQLERLEAALHQATGR